MSDHQEFEVLPLNSEVPHFRYLRNIEDLRSKSSIDIGLDFIRRLSDCVKNKKTSELRQMYDYEFNRLSSDIFKSEPWPTIADIEDQREQEFDVTIHYLYTELTNRHIIARCNQSMTPEMRFSSYENYLEIFQDVINDSKDKITLPPEWIWDMLDEFIYHFQTFCQFRAKIKDENDKVFQDHKGSASIPSLTGVVEILTMFTKESGVLDGNKLSIVEKPVTRQYFGYFAIVALLRLHVHVAEIDEALKALECVSMKALPIFARSYPCLINFFYYAGSAYLMAGRFREAGNLLQLIPIYHERYPDHYSETFQVKTLTSITEKTLHLLALCNKLCPLGMDDFIQHHAKELLLGKHNYYETFTERFAKISKEDMSSVAECFNVGCPKIIMPIRNPEDWNTLGFDMNTYDAINVQKDNLTKNASKIFALNQLGSILKLYSNITIPKLAKILGTDEKTCREQLELYAKSNCTPDMSKSLFESDVLSKLVEVKGGVSFKFKGTSAIDITNVQEAGSFAKAIEAGMKKLDLLMDELSTV